MVKIAVRDFVTRRGLSRLDASHTQNIEIDEIPYCIREKSIKFPTKSRGNLSEIN